MIRNTHSKAFFLILCIDIILIEQYTFSMSIDILKADNLFSLLAGMSLLEDRDQEQIISVVDALDFAYEKVNIKMIADVPKPQKVKSLV